jgi:hypothetical protein
VVFRRAWLREPEQGAWYVVPKLIGPAPTGCFAPACSKGNVRRGIILKLKRGIRSIPGDFAKACLDERCRGGIKCRQLKWIQEIKMPVGIFNQFFGRANMLRLWGRVLFLGVFGLAVLSSGCASEMFKTAGVESSQGKVNEVAFVINQNKFLPDEVNVTPNSVVRVWVANLDPNPVRVTLKAESPVTAELKCKQVGKLDLQSPKIGSYEMTYTGKNGEIKKALLKVTPQLQNNQVVLIQDFQAFFPIKTRVNASTPLKLCVASVTWAPHHDFVIYGTEVQLPFKNGEVSLLEIKDGLKAGEYVISRPGYPGQNHGIKSAISVEGQAFK